MTSSACSVILRCLQKTLERCLDRWRRSFVDYFVDWMRWLRSASPFAVLTLDPEHVFKSVGDGKASIGPAFWNDSLRPEVHGYVRPIVLTGSEVVPLGLE